MLRVLKGFRHYLLDSIGWMWVCSMTETKLGSLKSLAIHYWDVTTPFWKSALCNNSELYYILLFFSSKSFEFLQNKPSFIALHITNLSHKVGRIRFSYTSKQPNLQPVPGMLICVHKLLTHAEGSRGNQPKTPAGTVCLKATLSRRYKPLPSYLGAVLLCRHSANCRLFLTGVRRH